MIRYAKARPPAGLLALSLWLFLAGGIEAREDLKPQIDAVAEPLLEHRMTVGVAVGLLEGDSVREFGYGRISRQTDRKPDSRTVFEIGSVTKVFVTLALSDMVEEGRVKLSDPVAVYLPDSVRVPQFEGRQITLGHLAEHTSGLPRIPNNFTPSNPLNPYADYTAEKMYDFLSAFPLPRAPGSCYEYSNLGAGLLGHVLARHTGRDLAALLQERICRPLNLVDTSIRVSPDGQLRLTPGHDLDANPVPYWDFDVLAGAGALHSTVADLVLFVKANMGLLPTPLFPAMEKCRAPRMVTNLGDWHIGLGWHVSADGNTAWHNGGTYGFYSFIGFNRERKVGLVWLSNSSLWQIPDVNARLLDILAGKSAEPMKFKTPVPLPVETLDRYVGEYRPAPEATLRVRRDGTRLILQNPDGAETALFPESQTRFFLRETSETTVEFVLDEGGDTVRMDLHGKEGDKSAARVR